MANAVLWDAGTLIDLLNEKSRETYTRCLQEVEAPVAEVVVALQTRNDRSVVGERDFDDVTPEEIRFWEHSFRVEGVTRAEGSLSE